MKAMSTYDRTDDLIASYSSKGPSYLDHVVKPDLVAPGNMVVSLLAPGNPTLAAEFPQNAVPVSYYTNSMLPNRLPWSQPSLNYFLLSGTSMATPVLSGAVADLLQAQPTLTPDQVKAMLMRTAYKTFPTSSVATDPATGETFVSEYDIFTVGAGYLDLSAALQSKGAPTGSALSPFASYDPTSGKVFIQLDPNSLLSTNSAWAQTALGAPTVPGERIAPGEPASSMQTIQPGGPTVLGAPVHLRDSVSSGQPTAPGAPTAPGERIAPGEPVR